MISRRHQSVPIKFIITSSLHYLILKMLPKFRFLLGLSAASHAASAITDLDCTPDAIPYPSFLGGEVLNLTATEVHNYSTTTIGLGVNEGTIVSGVDFCNVSITHTHPGWNDMVHTQVWLPLGNWNGRFQATGGAGWSAGLDYYFMAYPVSVGYAGAFTDGGHEISFSLETSPASWAQTSPGNINWDLLQDFASTALNDMTLIAKAVIESYYGTPPRYSYWAGCSEGGAQGLLMAQRFPGAYDGILALAPGVNAPMVISSAYYATHVMNQLDYYPEACEMNAFTQAAIDACDVLDGLEDGIIAAPGLCHFAPHTLVGKIYTCNNETAVYTAAGASIAQAAWVGPRNYTQHIRSYGLNKDANITTYYTATSCSSNGTCTANPVEYFTSWYQYFVTRNPDFDLRSMTDADFYSLIETARDQYDSILGANNPNLARFRAAGGKMITWHGLADEVNPPNNSASYYEDVLRLDPSARDFYRYFQAPGVGHCFGGAGPYPGDTLERLVDWVENGTAPNTIGATSSNGTARNLCQYPLRQIYVSGDTKQASSFQCVE